MQSDLTVCRFCGNTPSIKAIEEQGLYIPGFSNKEKEVLYAIKCDKCLHLLYPTYLKDLDKLKKAWNARNSQYNPFIKENSDAK